MKLIFILSFLLIGWNSYATNPFRVAFYNVENLFDPEDEPDKDDEEYLPEGNRRWTYGRYHNKLNNLAKSITLMGEWDTPALIGMCEVENDKVMKDLTQYSPLRKMNYRYIITDSDDARGVDVALLYQRNRFKYLHHQSLKIYFPNNPSKKTRDVLHVSGQIISGDTLDVFVCHFPSRRGGEAESEPDRMQVASIVRQHADSLMTVRKNAQILIMGDFNDEPMNKSMEEILGAKNPNIDEISENDSARNNEFQDNEQNKRLKLYNLFYPIAQTAQCGSYKFGNQWNFLDQIIVSSNLLTEENDFYVIPKSASIFQHPALLTEDTTHGGKRPKKTFHGYKHEGGYSDHLPIVVNFAEKTAECD